MTRNDSDWLGRRTTSTDEVTMVDVAMAMKPRWASLTAMACFSSPGRAWNRFDASNRSSTSARSMPWPTTNPKPMSA